MPDFINSPFDTAPPKAAAATVPVDATPTVPPSLPASGVEALVRGLRGRCPRCSEAKLFRRFLKPAARCPQCRQDWTHQRADDFPAYVSIFVTGHILGPLIITLVRDTNLSVTALIAIVLPLAVVLMIGLLQPAKGAIVALQWWFGMHGFQKERPTALTTDAEP